MAEISALRQHYISSGGYDPTVLRQLNEMLQEAEEMTHQAPQKQIHGRKHVDPAILALESENLKLQKELASYEKKSSFDKECKYLLHFISDYCRNLAQPVLMTF